MLHTSEVMDNVSLDENVSAEDSDITPEVLNVLDMVEDLAGLDAETRSFLAHKHLGAILLRPHPHLEKSSNLEKHQQQLAISNI